MKEGSISSIRNLLTNKGDMEKHVNINMLGSLHLIGFYPARLTEGKKLFKNLIEIINQSEIYISQTQKIEAFIFNRLSFMIKNQKWNQFPIDDLFKTFYYIGENEKGIPLRNTRYSNDVNYHKIEYGIIERKVQQKNLDENYEELVFHLKKFDFWVKEYLSVFSENFKQKNNLEELLRLIVSK